MNLLRAACEQKFEKLVAAMLPCCFTAGIAGMASTSKHEPHGPEVKSASMVADLHQPAPVLAAEPNWRS